MDLRKIKNSKIKYYKFQHHTDKVPAYYQKGIKPSDWIEFDDQTNKSDHKYTILSIQIDSDKFSGF